MAKPTLTEVTTAQTFQNWLDKTNELVTLFKDNTLTASVTGDLTVGDAVLEGDFTANTVTAFDVLLTDDIESRTSGATIDFNSPIDITASLNSTCATFTFGATGGRTSYTDGLAITWHNGIDNRVNGNFTIETGAGGQFVLSPAGILTVPSLVVTSEIEFPKSANGEVVGELLVANATITDTLIANNCTFTTAYSDDFRGKFTGDIYHPAGQKILENGGPLANIPATFTGNVLGTVSSLLNHSTNSLNEGTNKSVGESSFGAGDGRNNLYFTNARAADAIIGGTGVTVATTADTNGRYPISIGQAVGTNSDVQFKSVVASGNITAYGTVSDITMKENISPITNALEKVAKLGGYTFNYKGDDNRMTGVMAQELMDVLPEVVYETEDPQTKEKIFAVRHGNIIGLLIEAIKELKEQVGK